MDFALEKEPPYKIDTNKAFCVRFLEPSRREVWAITADVSYGNLDGVFRGMRRFLMDGPSFDGTKGEWHPWRLEITSIQTQNRPVRRAIGSIREGVLQVITANPGVLRRSSELMQAFQNWNSKRGDNNKEAHDDDDDERSIAKPLPPCRPRELIVYLGIDGKVENEQVGDGVIQVIPGNVNEVRNVGAGDNATQIFGDIDIAGLDL